MFTLKVSKATPTRVQVQIEENGKLVQSYGMAVSSLQQQRTLAKQLSVRISDIVPVLTLAMQEGFATVAFGQIEEAFGIYVRGLNSPAHTSIRIHGEAPTDCLIKAIASLQCADPEPVLSWKDIGKLCCVDIDYHNFPLDQRPEWSQLSLAASMIRPVPVVYHPSHGRGMKLYYVASEGFDANEIAAAGAMAWLAADGRATVELKTETRHPLYARDGVFIPTSPKVLGIQKLEMVEIAKWNEREENAEAVDSLLEQRGWVKNKRYPHSFCLIDPDTPSHGEPVFIGDSGVFCQRCSAVGNTYGSRRTPGFVPYSALIGGIDSEVYNMAFRRAHWTHAKYVLQHHFKLSEQILRLAYSCALKLLHGPNNPVVAAAFTTEPIARVGGKWIFTTDPNLTTVEKNSKNIYAKLPATWNVFASEMGSYTVKPDLAKIEAISHIGRTLDDYGYPDLSPVHGMQMWGRRLPYASGTIPFPSQFLHLPSDRRPKYIPKKKRTPEVVEASWALLEEVFPDIDKRFVRLLLAARGIAESGANNVFICVSGPAGSGKSTTTAIVAGLCGDHHGECPYVKDSTRFRQSMMDSLTRGTFVVIDELFKTAVKERQTYRQAMDTVLTLTKNSRTHQLYVGSVTMPSCGVFSFTDIDVPQEIRDDIQLARRLTYIKLSARVDWQTSMNRAGLDKPENFRLLSGEHSFAADVICSEACDEFFSTVNTWPDLVAMCGATMLEKSTDFADTADLFRQLFTLVCDAPPLDETNAKRVYGTDFKKISLADSTDLRDVWDQLADGLSGQGWKTSRRISEIDWSRLLTNYYPDSRIPRGVTVDIRHYKDSTIYLRFRLGSFERPEATNREILTWSPPQQTTANESTKSGSST